MLGDERFEGGQATCLNGQCNTFKSEMSYKISYLQPSTGKIQFSPTLGKASAREQNCRWEFGTVNGLVTIQLLELASQHRV
jgi:hypothetical protein